LKLKEGRWPIAGKREVFVGYLVTKEMFPDMNVGDQVAIRGKQFKVVGVL